MFRWFTRNKKVTLPPLAPNNPGIGTSLRVKFANAQRSWTEDADIIGMLAELLTARDLQFERGDVWVRMSNGLLLRPRIVTIQPRDDGNVSTTTTLDVNHPLLCTAGTFEFQHSIAATASESLQQGLTGWADTDLPVFIDALSPGSETCNSLRLSFPAQGTNLQHRRQAILGPPLHFKQRDAVAGASTEPHDFCPCCLFLNSLEAFEAQLESDEFIGVRLFASRNDDGIGEADCRVNGVTWQPGVDALLKYIAGWPDRGLEFRKQFVGIRSVQPVAPTK